jgi:hypothetical protein
MKKKLTAGKRQEKPAIQIVRRALTGFIKAVVYQLVKKACHDRIKTLTGVDLWHEVVPPAGFNRCYRRAVADFNSGSGHCTTPRCLTETLAYWTMLRLPDLVGEEFLAPGADKLILRHIARSVQALAFENTALRLNSELQSASPLTLESGPAVQSTPAPVGACAPHHCVDPEPDDAYYGAPHSECPSLFGEMPLSGHQVCGGCELWSDCERLAKARQRRQS